MFRFGTWALCIAMGVAIGAPTGALAQSEAPVQSEETSEEDEERARTLYRLGDEHYANGRYEDAVAAFEESYALSGRPLLLFNMANAQERAGRYDDAIDSLERYLPDAPEEERARIDARLTSLRARAARVRDLTSGPEETEPEDEGSSISPLGATLVGVGGAALVGGVLLALRAKGARDDLDNLCADANGRRVCQPGAEDLESRDLRSSIGADVLFVAGAAALGVGLYFLLRPDDDETPTDEVDAVISEDTAYARWTHAF